MKFTDCAGSKRIGVVASCPICDKEFVSRKDKLKTTCSPECRGKLQSQENRTDKSCALCEKTISVKKSHKTKSGLYFCSQDCKNTAQRIGGIKEIMPSHYGTGTHPLTYRTIYKRMNNVEDLSCSRCGYCEFQCGIDIHHIDENKQNNDSSNLIPLCSPCHRGLHFKMWNMNELIPVAPL